MQLTQEQERFKEAYIRARGYWVAFNDGLLMHSPEWLKAYLKYAETPAVTGPLEPKLREMIYVAIDASTTHMFTEGMEIHINLAFEAGCTVAQLIEVMQITTLQGLDSVSNGMTILMEEAEKSGIALYGLPELEDNQPESLLTHYEDLYGHRPAWLKTMAHVAPEYTETLIELLVTAESHSTLTAKEKTLIRLALAASPTHLNQSAMRTEIRHALSIGATTNEIVQVFQLAAHLGIHACVDGVPSIVAAAKDRD